MKKSKRLRVNNFYFLFLSFFIFPWQAYSQSKRYKITFDCSLSNIQPIKVPDSITMVRNGDSIKIPWSASSKIKLNTKLMVIEVVANDKKSTIKVIDKSSGWGDDSYKKMPDSLVYQSTKWLAFTKGKIKKIPFEKEEYLFAKDIKTILGYRCSKVITLNYKGEKEMESWVTEKLPSTIMPYSGSKPMKGAIMESRNVRTGISYVATNIKLL